MVKERRRIRVSHLTGDAVGVATAAAGVKGIEEHMPRHLERHDRQNQTPATKPELQDRGTDEGTHCAQQKEHDRLDGTPGRGVGGSTEQYRDTAD